MDGNIVDTIQIGNILETEFLFRFAVIGSFGIGGENITLPFDYRNPDSNFYTKKVADRIKTLKIDYIFSAGDSSHNFELSRASNNVPYLADSNVGRFYNQYIGFYRGLYNINGDINASLLSLGLKNPVQKYYIPFSSEYEHRIIFAEHPNAEDVVYIKNERINALQNYYINYKLKIFGKYKRIETLLSHDTVSLSRDGRIVGYIKDTGVFDQFIFVYDNENRANFGILTINVQSYNCS